MRTSKGDLSAGMSAYQQFGVRTEIESATPHKLIQMLINGALAKMRVARTCTERGDIVGKCENIDWAIAIIGGLRGSLNLEDGGVIATNLDGLYEYMCRQLALANARSDVGLIDEVIGLLGEIKAGWDGIESEATADTVAAAN